MQSGRSAGARQQIQKEAAYSAGDPCFFVSRLELHPRTHAKDGQDERSGRATELEGTGGVREMARGDGEGERTGGQRGATGIIMGPTVPAAQKELENGEK